MKEYLLDGVEDYKLISQKGVRQFVFPLDSDHNAIWDTSLSPKGVLYFALATELSTAGYVRLCRYDYGTNSVKELFKVENVIMPSDRTIRASKFHTSISYLNDGRMLMTTHTTDKSPAHPTWMPIPYFHHVWEGYAGSNIVIYDPVTQKAENLGIPVPRESIYGALYDAKHNALFFTGCFKGHTYRYSLDDKKLIDFGQYSENMAFRLLYGKDGKIYSCSRSGYMYRIDTDTLQTEDLNYRIPYEIYPKYDMDFKGLSNGGIGPDGRLYMCFFYSRKFVAFDCDTSEFEDMGDYLPAACHARGESRNGVFAMDFDRQGVLWYAVFSRNCDSGQREYGLPSSLFRWDIARGGKPEWMGVIGTRERAACWTSEICISDDDILYCIGSNHSMDGPDITAIDLKEYRKDMYNFGKELTADEYFVNRDSERYNRMSDFIYEKYKISKENNWKFDRKFAFAPVRLWRALAPDSIGNSSVKILFWEDADTLAGICGLEREYVFRITRGELKELKPWEECEEDYAGLMKHAPIIDADKYRNAVLPHYPGRQYKAVPAAEAALSGSRTLVATEDGMLAVFDGRKVFGLGPAVYNGPVRCMSTAPGKNVVYGVGGDADDIGIVFSYDDESGLNWLGHVNFDKPSDIGAINCPVLNACAVSPDSSILAIGSGDRLGTVVFYDIRE